MMPLLHLVLKIQFILERIGFELFFCLYGHLGQSNEQDQVYL